MSNHRYGLQVNIAISNFHLLLCILLAGDIATNPGPACSSTYSCPVQNTALRCLSFNARSLKSVNKQEDGSTTSNLSMFQDLVYSDSFDIITVTETWLNDTILNKEILPCGYNIAFDRVDHRLLVRKLKKFGIGGTLLKRFEDYLTNRHQRVTVLCKTLHSLPVLSGVSQGSILGSLLFVIYVNDLPQETSTSSIALYADDTKCYRPVRSHKDEQYLQKDLDGINNWGNYKDKKPVQDTTSHVPPGSMGGAFSFVVITGSALAAAAAAAALCGIAVEEVTKELGATAFGLTNRSTVGDVAKDVRINAVSLGALYCGYEQLKPVIEGAVKKGLGGERDQDIPRIKPGSLHVLLCCFTDQRFLDVLNWKIMNLEE
ncbi:Hypothetical predicted protein [Paramuricea clavata]|uniref:Uncharacterized protein n=1 Tax=Paramuricea clavata TaxID=317549 RepID=A0A6S7JAK9_PARCT|nr:Hypothetical predicted protein [Paramuricea clavata]